MRCKACNKAMSEKEQYWDDRRNCLNEYCLECIRADNMGLDTPAIIERYEQQFADSVMEQRSNGGVSGEPVEILLDNLDSLIFTEGMEVWE